MRQIIVILFIQSVLIQSVAGLAASKPSMDKPFWAGDPNAATYTRIQDERLTKAQAILDQMLRVKGKRTVENTLRPYDEILLNVDSVDSESWLIKAVHPDLNLRSAAEKADEKAEMFSAALSLNRKVYEALAAVDLTGADGETQYYIEKTLRQFRIAGVDKDAETQKRIKALHAELITLGQEFSRNIQSDLRTVAVKNTAELNGLPQDYISRHGPDASGRIMLSIDYPDSTPVFSYAKSDDLRRRMYVEVTNRAYPLNMPVLDRMITKRYELANLLGFPSWADYITADKMVGNAKNAARFLDQVAEASKPRAESEYQTLLKRKQRDFPDASVINAWDVDYWSGKVKQSEFQFDGQEARPYFPYEQVKAGVLEVTSKLFGVNFRQVKDAAVWHPSVEYWEMLENGELVGRFYLDMHPRPDKYSHGAHFPIRTGVAGRQIAESALVCNFPGSVQGDPGLMEHGDVQTFFHEFGHLMHHLFAGRHRWLGIGGVRMELDFQEAPSQMLEEWMWDPVTLRLFAKHYKTGEPIPGELVERMKKAKEFGKGMQVRDQILYAEMSLSFHDRNPSQVNTDQITKNLTRELVSYPFVEGTHYQCKFTHLDDYSSLVYTYLWSQVIAKDMFSEFSRADLLCPEIARRYRNVILAPGGSAPASMLVENFLGRPFNFAAWQAWLNSN